MNGWVSWFVAACYVSVGLELALLHTPSVASSRSIWAASEDTLRHHSERYRRLYRLSRPVKFVRFFLPLLVVWATFAFPLVAAWVRDDPFHDFLYRAPLAATLAAAALMFAGRAVTLVATLSMRGTHDGMGRGDRLEIRGPYRWSRNPGLVGMYLMFAGFWLVYPSPLFLLGIVVYVAHMHFKVRIEEDYLAHRFGEPYTSYAGRTARYFG